MYIQDTGNWMNKLLNKINKKLQARTRATVAKLIVQY